MNFTYEQILFTLLFTTPVLVLAHGYLKKLEKKINQKPNRKVAPKASVTLEELEKRVVALERANRKRET